MLLCVSFIPHRCYFSFVAWLLALLSAFAVPITADAMTTPLAKSASWSRNQSASGRSGDELPASQAPIGYFEPCDYESASGRATWLTRDPIGEEGGLNLYGYVSNQPLNYTDPKGEWAEIAVGIGALLIIASLATMCQNAHDLNKHQDSIPPKTREQYEQTMDGGTPPAHANEAVNEAMPELRKGIDGLAGAPGTPTGGGPVDVPLDNIDLVPTFWGKIGEWWNKPKDSKPKDDKDSKSEKACPKK